MIPLAHNEMSSSILLAFSTVFIVIFPYYLTPKHGFNPVVLELSIENYRLYYCGKNERKQASVSH